MESGASIVPGHGGSLATTQRIGRKKWIVVSENSVRDRGNEELERQTKSQPEEGAMYEEKEHFDIDFGSVTIDSGLKNLENEDPLRQRLHGIARQREELQRMEIELRAQFIARAEIMQIQSEFDEQAKQHADIAANLQEQLEERDHQIHDLEQKLEQRERELQANQIETNEAVWAKDDLLREQDNKLATIRRERDNAEAERKQHLAQIQDLKQQLHDKEQQVQEMEEQRRAVQDVLLYKDEQLREAQAWVARIQEMDAFHSNNNHTLQAELRDRTDQFNQLWLSCQRQLADVERHHLQTIQQLQLELSEAREQSHIFGNSPGLTSSNAKEEMLSNTKSQGGDHYDTNEEPTLKDGMRATSAVVNNQANLGFLSNGSVDGPISLILSHDASPKVEHATGLPIIPSSVLGMNAFLPSGPVPTMQQLVMHQHGITQPTQHPTVHIPQPPLGQFQPMPAGVPPQHHLLPNQHQRAIPDNYQSPHQLHASQVQQYPLRVQTHLEYQSSNSQVLQSKYQEQQLHSQQVKTGIDAVDAQGEEQAQKPREKGQVEVSSPQFQQKYDENASQQQDLPGLVQPDQICEQELRLESAEKSEGLELPKLQSFTLHQNNIQSSQMQSGDEVVAIKTQQLAHQSDINRLLPVSRVSVSVSSSQSGSSRHIKGGVINGKTIPDTHSLQTLSLQSSMPSTTQDGCCKASEPSLLDERSLLACLVRAIPAEASARIRISTTLPNRLGKMLAPLHWHDYKKCYGRLDEFVACHPELFIIEGEFVHLREGAHAMISATTAVAKVAAAAAAAAAASPVGSAWSPTVAVTPVAQVHRSRKGFVINQEDNKNTSIVSAMGQIVFSNGVQFKHAQRDSDGFSLDSRTDGSTVYLNAANVAHGKEVANGFQSTGTNIGRNEMHFGNRQQGRVVGSGSYVKQ
eukprot:Gb_40367 [translate_table: standard]